MSDIVRVVPLNVTGHPAEAEARDLDPRGADAPTVTDLGRGRVRLARAADDARANHDGTVASAPSSSGAPRRLEVVVDGWRFELEVEDARRARIRRWATRTADATTASGPADIRAIIPGRIAAVRVTAGEIVQAGETLLVVEAMKMQNELRAPRSGTVERVAVGEGQTIERGDLLVVLT